MGEPDRPSASAEARAERFRLQALLDRVTSTADGLPARLEALCRVAVDTLSMSGAVVSLMAVSRPGGVLSGAVVAASDAQARRVEELEFSAGEGPGRDAFLTSRPVLTPDLRQVSNKWLAYVPAALATGTRGSLAFPMGVGAVRLGVLNLHSSQPHTLTSREVGSCLTLTEMATGIVLTAESPLARGEVTEALLRGTGGRDQIYQAQGLVSVDLNITLTDALARMRAFAFSSGQDLASLASALMSGLAHMPSDNPDNDTDCDAQTDERQ